MILRRDELALARAYEQVHEFEGLTDEQMSAIMTRGRELFHWFKAHPRTHNAINVVVIVSLLAADFFALMVLPARFRPPGEPRTPGMVLLAGAVAGSLRSYLLDSMSAFSLHEAASHRIAIVGGGWFTRAGQGLAANLGRLADLRELNAFKSSPAAAPATKLR